MKRNTSSLAAAGARGGFAAVTLQGIVLVAGLASIIWLGRLLPPEYFGLVAAVSALAEFAGGVIDFGLPLAAAQSQSLSARAKSTLFLVNSLLGTAFSVAFLAGSTLAAHVYGDDRLSEVTRWLSLVPLAVGLSAQSRAQLMSDLRFVSLEVISTIARLIAMVAAVAVAATTGSLYALVILAVLPQVIQLPWLVIAARWRPGRPGSWTESRDIVAVGSRIFGLNFLKNLARTVTIPILGVIESPRNVGFYDRAYQLSLTPANVLTDSLAQIVVPVLSRKRAEIEELQRAFEKVQTTTILTLVSAIWVFAALGEPIVELTLGATWLPAGGVMQLLAIGAGFRLMGIMQQWLFISGQATGAGLIFSVWAQPLVIVVSLAGLPWGIDGVAATTAVAWVILWPLSTVAAAKATGLNGKSILSKSGGTALSFSAPVAISATLPRIYLEDPLLIVFIGFVMALIVAACLILLRPSLRGSVTELLASVLGGRLLRSRNSSE